MKKLVFITPHLSTGGLPSYLLKQVELLKKEFDIYVIEYTDLTGGIFTVHKNKIISFLKKGNFITLKDDKHELIRIINSINPDIIHFEEFPEMFVDRSILENIYLKANRKYFIIETTHSSGFTVNDKMFLPDKFVFVSNDSVQKFSEFNIPIELCEYPIEYNIRPDRAESLKKLGLNPEYKHVLNVGLFTPGKNQSEIFNYAKSLLDYKIQFHFVGNQAGNFQNYWGPLMENKPENCIVWGERSDVDLFYSACDLFLFTSLTELNPIVLREAISWKLPILMYDLPIYAKQFDKYNTFYLSNDLELNRKLILEHLGIFSNFKIKLVHLLSFPDEEVEKKSIAELKQFENYGIKYVQMVNGREEKLPEETPLYNTDQWGGSLKPGHYGNWKAFKNAIDLEFTDDVDFLLVCERDCMLDTTPEIFYSKLIKYISIINKEDISYFSFGEPIDNKTNIVYSNIKRKIEYTDDLYITDKIIRTHCVLFPKSSKAFLKDKFANVGWYGIDIWFNYVFNSEELPMAIVSKRLTYQEDGKSLTD